MKLVVYLGSGQYKRNLTILPLIILHRAYILVTVGPVINRAWLESLFLGQKVKVYIMPFGKIDLETIINNSCPDME